MENISSVVSGFEKGYAMIKINYIVNWLFLGNVLTYSEVLSLGDGTMDGEPGFKAEK